MAIKLRTLRPTLRRRSFEHFRKSTTSVCEQKSNATSKSLSGCLSLIDEATEAKDSHLKRLADGAVPSAAMEDAAAAAVLEYSLMLLLVGSWDRFCSKLRTNNLLKFV